VGNDGACSIVNRRLVHKLVIEIHVELWHQFPKIECMFVLKIKYLVHVLKIKIKCCSTEWYDYIVHSNTIWFYLLKDESKQAN